MSGSSIVEELLERADVARLSGRGDVAARLYDEAIECCRAEGDLALRTRAALGAAAVYVFGAEPGKLPAELYDVLLRTTDDGGRARVAAALARCWVYAGHASRALRFADEAVDRARRVAQPELLADCLDAALAAHWGPDDLDTRVELAGQLDDVAAHLLDPDARLRAHLWAVQVACEALNLPAVHRHLRALEGLGQESARASFFAASRRLMLDLLQGRTDRVPALIQRATEASQGAGLADAWMVVEAMRGYSAVQTGDAGICAEVAAECEAFGIAEGAPVVSAEAAYLWVGAGRPDRAGALVQTFDGPTLAGLPRDVNWLLTLQCVLEAALATGHRDVVEEAARLLAPYSGRAVFNSGVVAFHGLTDDTLARAAESRGDPDAAEQLRGRAVATYERLGATWWRDRLVARGPALPSPPGSPAGPFRLQETLDGLWIVGTRDHVVPVRGLRGFFHLRELLRRPGVPVAALDLVTGGTATVVQPDLGETLDRRAVNEYRSRLADIENDAAEAADWADLGRLDRLHAERDALINELTQATGLHGRRRKPGSTDERARVAATKAITTAIERIAGVDQALGAHLRSTVHTGGQCTYAPDPAHPPEWILARGP